MKCDKCNNPATVHLIEIKNGKKVERHLCEEHAVEEGVTVKVTNAPINELLEKFVLKHSGEVSGQTEMVCDHCGLSYEEFRKTGQLGCPHCYEVFEQVLTPLLARAHGGHTQHIGKVPRQAGRDQHRQQRLLQLRRQLDEAVVAERFEQAASLRDQVRQLEAENE
jgi:protein arginine kinase activator